LVKLSIRNILFLLVRILLEVSMIGMLIVFTVFDGLHNA